VSGFLTDRKVDPSAVVLGDDVDLEKGSLGDRMHALLHGGHHALLVPEALATPLADAIVHGGPPNGLRVTERRPVARASFGMRAEVYSRDVAAQLRGALRGAPMSQHTENEEAHSGAEGVELYSPAHAYTFRVQATVNGPVGDVLAVRGDLADIPAATLGPLRLS
jgi:hypothetical protein